MGTVGANPQKDARESRRVNGDCALTEDHAAGNRTFKNSTVGRSVYSGVAGHKLTAMGIRDVPCRTMLPPKANELPTAECVIMPCQGIVGSTMGGKNRDAGS